MGISDKIACLFCSFCQKKELLTQNYPHEMNSTFRKNKFCLICLTGSTLCDTIYPAEGKTPITKNTDRLHHERG